MRKHWFAVNARRQEGREGAWHVGGGASDLAPELVAFRYGSVGTRQISHALDVYSVGLIVGWLLFRHSLGNLRHKVRTHTAIIICIYYTHYNQRCLNEANICT